MPKPGRVMWIYKLTGRTWTRTCMHTRERSPIQTELSHIVTSKPPDLGYFAAHIMGGALLCINQVANRCYIQAVTLCVDRPLLFTRCENRQWCMCGRACTFERVGQRPTVITPCLNLTSKPCPPDLQKGSPTSLGVTVCLRERFAKSLVHSCSG